MPLPEGFEFSQASLQGFTDCERRFQLRYVDRQPWPAVEVEPVLEHEQFSVRGQQFHQMVERYYAGVPAEAIEQTLPDLGELRQWWRNFRQEPPLNLPDTLVMPEVRFSIPLGDARLVAVFDLLALDPGQRLVIVDWKTSRRRPEREVMARRLQTRVYPYVAVQAAAHLFGEEVDPARVTMVYWFAAYPDQPHVFHYDVAQHVGAEEDLLDVVAAIKVRDPEQVWPLTEDERQCRYCVYRSLCGRGVAAGELDSFEDDFVGDLSLDWDDVGEVQF